MSPEAAYSMLSLSIGFACAGMTASGYQTVTARRLGFSSLNQKETRKALAAVPCVVLAAPFLIMRNTLLGSAQEERHASFVALSTIIAGLWSLLSGSLIVSGWMAAIRLIA